MMFGLALTNYLQPFRNFIVKLVKVLSVTIPAHWIRQIKYVTVSAKTLQVQIQILAYFSKFEIS